MVDLFIPHIFTEQNSRKYILQRVENQNTVVYQKRRDGISLPGN